MKKILLIILAMQMFLSINIYAQEFENQVYNYPITANDEEWKELQTLEEKLDVTQIPEDLLEKMSTDDLLKTVMNYPLLGNLIAYSDIHTGIEKVSSQFNGLEELFKRSDVGEVIMDYYINIPITRSTENIMDLICLEIMLSAPVVVDTISASMIEMSIAEKYEKKSMISDIYYSDIDTFDNSLTRNINATIYTPKGSVVSVIKRSPDITSAEKISYNNYMSSRYPNAIYVRSATTNYNCNSYAWYNRNSSNVYWMNSPM